MLTKEMTTMVARYTGWSLEYIGLLSFRRLRQLVADLDYQRSIELYRIEFRIGQLLAMTASGKNRTYKSEDFVGTMPERTEVAMNKSKKPEPQTVVLGDGNEYTLPLINANIMEAVEEALDKDWASIFQHLRVKHLKMIVLQMLILQYPNLTIDEVGSLLTVEAIKNVSEALPKLL